MVGQTVPAIVSVLKENMAELPDGTVTFLLTDVEGSTALWEMAPEAMRSALVRHDALFEAAVTQHGGSHIRPRGEGDSRFAVFAGAPEARRRHAYDPAGLCHRVVGNTPADCA